MSAAISAALWHLVGLRARRVRAGYVPMTAALLMAAVLLVAVVPTVSSRQGLSAGSTTEDLPAGTGDRGSLTVDPVTDETILAEPAATAGGTGGTGPATPRPTGQACSPAATGGIDGWHNWRAPSGGVFRQGAYCGGEWVYTNTVQLGNGANSDRLRRADYSQPVRPVSTDVANLLTYDLFGVHRSAHNGDYVLPTDRERWPDFTGELAELRLAADGDELFVRLRYTSMPRPDAQIATLAFATHGLSVAASDWPAGANVRSPWQAALTMWGTGASVTTAGGESVGLVDLGGAVRTGDHVVDVRVPLSALPPGPWALTGGAGLADPDDPSRYWMMLPGEATPVRPGNPGVSDAAVWSLLFARDQPWTFDDGLQSELLWQGDASTARETVDLAALQAGGTAGAPVRIGRQSRVFESRLDLGDGIERGNVDFVDQRPPGESPVGLPARDPARWYQYQGRLQPYSLYVPSSYASAPADRTFPLIVYLHGLNGYIDEPFGPVLGLEAAAEDRGYLLAGALGRGDNLYRGAGEVDVLEMIADLSAAYRVDPDRIYLMGHSMGAQGTYSVALRNPDLFAAAAPTQTTASPELWRNGRNLPWFHIAAVFDADADGTEAKAIYAQRSVEGWDSTVLNYQSKTHEYSSVYDTLPRLFSFFDTRRRDPSPPIVSYVTPERDDPALGLVHDGAYWVSGLILVTDGEPVSVEAETFGRPHRRIDPAVSTRTVTEVEEGGRSGGDTTAELLQTVPAYGPLLPAQNRATVTLRGARAVVLDLAAMALTTEAALVLDVDTDAEVELTLVGPGGGATTVIVPPGQHRVELGG